MGNVVLNLWACRAALWERVLGLILRKCTSGKLLSTRLLSLKNDGNSASLGVCGSRGFALGLGVLGTRLREAWGPASSGRFVCGVREWEVLASPQPLCACGVCSRLLPWRRWGCVPWREKVPLVGAESANCRRWEGNPPL